MILVCIVAIAIRLPSSSTELPRMGNKSIAVVPVDDKVAPIHNIRDIQMSDVKKFYAPIKNEAVYVALNEHSALPGVP